jgi:hypothetical protein
LFTEVSIKSACLKIFVSRTTSAGKVFFNSSRFFSIFRVTSSVLALGCFEI